MAQSEATTEPPKPATTLEPLVLAEGARVAKVPPHILDDAVRLALLEDGPDQEVPGWGDDAPCVGLPASVFYPSRGRALKPLRDLCNGTATTRPCAVRSACLAKALWNGEREGWWGGTSARGRQNLRKVLRSAGVLAVTGEHAYLAWREDDRDPPDPAPAPMVIHDPWPHQLRAVEACVEALRDGGSAQISMATASGKTYVAVLAAAGLGAERVLVLVPSLPLVAQTAEVWATDERWAGSRRLAVCSDAGELAIEATTDAAAVAAFLAEPGPALVFATYASSDVLASAACHFDLTVADEAHHLAGEADKAFSAVLRGEIPTRATLYMTATPRRFRKRQDLDLVDMDHPSFGPRVFEFPLSEAVAAGVVADYRVIVAAVERDVFDAIAKRPEMKGIDPHLLAGAIATVRAMGELHLDSCVSFHSRVDRARTFARLVGAVAEALPELRPQHKGWAGFVHGGASVRIRRRLLSRLADAKTWGVLANARALGEGIDVPTLGCVAIVDPKDSDQDVMQATGRALRRPTSDKVGTVLLPVLLSSHADPADPLGGCDRRSMDLVAGVLRALRSHDTELGSRLDHSRRKLGEPVTGRRGGVPNFMGELRRRAARGLLGSRVQFHVPGGATGELAGAMALHLVREASPSWEEALGRLLAYVAEHGVIPGQTGSYVPDETGTFNLGAWITTQRTLYRRGLLAPERVAALEAVRPWRWDPREEGWWEKFDALAHYMHTFGHDPGMGTRVEWHNGVNVGQFLNVTRSAITAKDGGWLLKFPDRIAALEALPGWCWNTKERTWNESFARLERYVAATGHAAPPGSEHNVGPHVIDGQHMGKWVQKQRGRIKAGTLREDRVERLRALPGWVDDYAGAKEENWDTMCHVLELFVDTYHRMPKQGERFGPYGIGCWVVVQRSARPEGKRPRSTMTVARCRRLERIPGWAWDTHEASWWSFYDQLKDYSANHHRPGRYLRIPASDLASWATGQRMAYSRNHLGAERAEALEAVPGWVWDVREARRELALDAIGTWLAREGPLDPTTEHKEHGIPIRGWIARFRSQHLKGDLDDDFAALLDELPGWSWEPLPSAALPRVQDPVTGRWR